jgi:hypothetical protein
VGGRAGASVGAPRRTSVEECNNAARHGWDSRDGGPGAQCHVRRQFNIAKRQACQTKAHRDGAGGRARAHALRPRARMHHTVTMVSVRKVNAIFYFAGKRKFIFLFL